MDDAYVHGYGVREAERLQDQASTLEALLHRGTAYPPGSRVLEAGCGVGAQTLALARRSPGAAITAVDLSAESIAQAHRRLARADVRNVTLRQADLMALPDGDGGFDHVFVCFVLEHLARPDHALKELRRVLRPGGTLTVIEGDHGSVLCHPDSAPLREAVAAQVALQGRAGGDACIGRRLHGLLAGAGFQEVRARPRIAYADGGSPAASEGFTRRTFAAMLEGVRASVVAAGIISDQRFDAGVRAVHRAAEPDGSFAYTFFKAVGRRPQDGS